MRALILSLVLVWCVAAQNKSDDDDRALAGVQAVETGRKIFLEACSACHGQNGGGGHGPSLVEGQRVRALKDAQLFQSIQKGVPGTDMPPSPLPEPQIRQVMAFVRSLGAPAVDAHVPGSLEAGQAIFFGKGRCSNCHSIRGQGGWIGPDLTNAGEARTLGQLRESLLEPSKRIAEGFEGVSLTTRDGKHIEGVAKNHDNYSIQVLDRQGKLHLLASADLAKLEIRQSSLMPADYSRQLSATEIQDVLAFLSRQTTRRRQSE